MTTYVLRHRSCGHLAGFANDRKMLEDQKRALESAGYHGWRVKSYADSYSVPESELAGLAGNARCAVCQIDPTRGLWCSGSAGSPGMPRPPGQVYAVHRRRRHRVVGTPAGQRALHR